MPAATNTIEDFLQTFNRQSIQKDIKQAEEERLKLVTRFPLNEWSQLSLDRYAYGLKNPQETFCWALENGTKEVAPLATHGSQAFKIYFRKADNRWWYEGDSKDEQTVWRSIRNIYLQAFARAQAGRWTQIDELHTSRYGTNALLKALICYFPQDLLPITSAAHICHFLTRLGLVDFDGRTQNIVNLNRLLLLRLKKTMLFEDWSTFELSRFLYAWAPPTSSTESAFEEAEEEETSAASTELNNPLFEKIAATLEYKGLVILCGPPGTGKTFTAESFAKHWLNTSSHRPSDEDTPNDSPTQTSSWLVVSNQQNHSWDNLFKNGTEIFRGGKLKANFKAARKGDLVFSYTGAPKQKLEAVARINREMFMDENNMHCIELAPIARIKHGVTFDDLQKTSALKKSECLQSNMRGTLFKLTPKEAEALAKLSIKKEPTLSGALLSQQSTATTHDKLIRLTFHPTYSYEDFIEGFRPDPTVSNNLTLKLKDGIFKRICKEADANRNCRYLILIDEINRANLAKVFGEVITIIEKDKRDLTVELPQSNDQFRVPPNVFVIGTMNTSDRSIKLFDIALRRRFSFIAMQPDTSLLAGAKINSLDLAALLEHLNAKLIASGNRDKQIGHAFFMHQGKPIADTATFAQVIRQDILPLLQEYCYDRYSDLANFIGTDLVDVHKDCLRDDRLNDDNRLLSALTKVVASESHDA